MNNMVDIEKVKQLQALSATNKVAEAFFELAAQRQKDKKEMTIRRAADVCHVEYWQMREVFQKLAEIGVGTYVTGRRGGKSRLRWLYSLSSVGRAARGELQSLVSLHDQDHGEAGEGEAPLSEEKVRQSNFSKMDHSFTLRPDYVVQLALPTDFSSREAERVAAWIRTLPFD